MFLKKSTFRSLLKGFKKAYQWCHFGQRLHHAAMWFSSILAKSEKNNKNKLLIFTNTNFALWFSCCKVRVVMVNIISYTFLGIIFYLFLIYVRVQGGI